MARILVPLGRVSPIFRQLVLANSGPCPYQVARVSREGRIARAPAFGPPQ